jgi:hypothetical protein
MANKSPFDRLTNTNPANRGVPGAGLDVLIAICAEPGRYRVDEQTSPIEQKGWFWLVEMRIHLGLVTQCHSVGFAIAPPGMDDLMITATPPEGDDAARLLTTITGYCIANRNLQSIRGSVRSLTDQTRLHAGLVTMAAEPDAAINLNDMIGGMGNPANINNSELMTGMARDTLCPGLGPVALRKALEGELAYVNQRRDLMLIAQDDAVEPTVLGANDNLPQPEVCTEAPSFDLLGS